MLPEPASHIRVLDFLTSSLPLPSWERILAGATPLRGHDKHREREREFRNSCSRHGDECTFECNRIRVPRCKFSSSRPLESIKFIRDYAEPVTRWKINVLASTKFRLRTFDSLLHRSARSIFSILKVDINTIFARYGDKCDAFEYLNKFCWMLEIATQQEGNSFSNVLACLIVELEKIRARKKRHRGKEVR